MDNQKSTSERMQVIEEFLKNKNSSTRSVVANADMAVQFKDEDVLLLVGSLAEGLNTDKSDLDLILITDRPSSAIPDGGHVGWIDGSCLVDMLVLPLSKVRALTDRFWQWHENAWNVTYALDYSLQERTILHRLYTGVHLKHSDHSQKYEVDIPDVRSLALLKLHTARHTARTIQVDLVGLKYNNDYRSLAIAAQELLGLTTDALLAGFELVNPLVKWRSRLLETVPDSWEDELWIPRTNRSAADHIWELQRLPEKAEERSAVRHTEAITSFSRIVFLWAEVKLRRSGGLDHMLSMSQIERTVDQDSYLPCLEFDMDFLITPESLAVSRLNEFKEPLTLRAEELKLLLHFDGATNRQDALLSVYSDQSLESGRPVLERLEKTLSTRNMLSLC